MPDLREFAWMRRAPSTTFSRQRRHDLVESII
jgi:hypothetical protein